jgi:hypothetical protein
VVERRGARRRGVHAAHVRASESCPHAGRGAGAARGRAPGRARGRRARAARTAPRGVRGRRRRRRRRRLQRRRAALALGAAGRAGTVDARRVPPTLLRLPRPSSWRSRCRRPCAPAAACTWS